MKTMKTTGTVTAPTKRDRAVPAALTPPSEPEPQRTATTRDAFLAAVASGDMAQISDATIRKALVADVEPVGAEDSRVRRFVASTRSVDRHNDTIDPSGWQLENFRRNPVVMWAHNYAMLPVGVGRSVGVDQDKLVIDVEFHTADLNPFADQVFRLVQRGFLRAVSVGFKPVRWTFNEDRRGFDFMAQDLLELSIVPLPANPEALIDGRGIEAAESQELREWAEATLRMCSGGNGFWVTAENFKSLLQPPPEPAKIADGKELEFDSTTSDGATVVTVSGVFQPEPQGKAVPGDVSTEKAPDGTPWSKPTLSDFTDEAFEELSARERNRIARYFAWAKSLPPTAFGDLKLPHHRANDGAIVFRGVAAAMGVLMGARGGVDVPSGDRRSIYNHLSRHYRAFDKEPPEFRFAEAEVLKHFPETYAFNDETGELTTKAPPSTAPTPDFAMLYAAFRRATKQTGFEIQTLVFPKTHWATQDAVMAWLTRHEFTADSVDETESAYRVHQRDGNDFARRRTIGLLPLGVEPTDPACMLKAVGGPLRATVPDADADLSARLMQLEAVLHEHLSVTETDRVLGLVERLIRDHPDTFGSEHEAHLRQAERYGQKITKLLGTLVRELEGDISATAVHQSSDDDKASTMHMRPTESADDVVLEFTADDDVVLELDHEDDAVLQLSDDIPTSTVDLDAGVGSAWLDNPRSADDTRFDWGERAALEDMLRDSIRQVASEHIRRELMAITGRPD